MENTTKFIKVACAGILFCMGVFLLIYGTGTYSKSIAAVREKVKDDNIFYQQYYPDAKIVTYSEVIATFFQVLEYDIEIDGYLINKIDHQAEKVVHYNIDKTDYFKTYLYDANGNVRKIVYSPIN